MKAMIDGYLRTTMSVLLIVWLVVVIGLNIERWLQNIVEEPKVIIIDNNNKESSVTIRRF